MNRTVVLFIAAIAVGCACSGCQTEKVKEDAAMDAENRLLDRADSVFRSRDYEGSRDVYLEAAKEAEASGDTSALTEAYSMIARTYLITGQRESGRPWIEKAEKLAKPDEPFGWSRYLGVRGRFEWQDEQLEKATATFTEMYDYTSGHKLHERAIDAAHMVAITGTHEQQIEWGKKGIAEAEAGNVTGWLGPLWNNLGATYEEMEKYQESLDAYLKAREYHHKYGDEANKFIADWAVGHAHRLVGNADEAEKWLTKTLEWCERAEATEFIGWCHKDLGEIELARENHKAALDHLEAAEEKLKAAGMPEWNPDGHKELVEQIEEIRAKTE
jgi:tetratricopeptide (TPR) repeat protein